MIQRIFFFSVLFVSAALVAIQNDGNGNKAEQSPALDSETIAYLRELQRKRDEFTKPGKKPICEIIKALRAKKATA
jgi:hypothetical protein